MEDLPVAESYEKDFDPEWYLRTYHEDHFDGRVKFSLDCLHETFKFKNGDIQGASLLDVGTGPSVHSVISASRHVTEIHLSDLVPRNMDILQKWRDGADNVPRAFQYIVDKENDGLSLEERIALVRCKVTQIYHLDYRLPEPLPESRIKYDVIIASLSFATSSRDMSEFESTIAKVAALLKETGYLLIFDALEGTSYRAGKFKFINVRLSREGTKKVLMDAGFKIENWREMRDGDYTRNDSVQVRDYSTVQDIFYAVCRKVSS